MRILGIETSCDETSAAVIEANPGDKTVKLLSNVVASSLKIHAKTGGIIPEIAAREQVKYIIPVITKALKDSNLYLPSSKNYPHSSTFYPPPIDAIAVTVGPGLIGSLLVGVETAKTLAYVWKKPIIPVNHLVGHIYANFIDETSPNLSLRAKRGNPLNNEIASSFKTPRNDTIPFLSLALIVSGGHTDLVLMKKHGSIKWLGGTRDDAAGEALDKIGRLLGLPYPGGPAIEKASERGDASRFTFPRPMIDSNDFDFSFSGLKTSVLYLIKKNPKVSVILGSPAQRDDSRISNRTERFWTSQNDTISDLAASIQQAVIDVLVTKTLKAAQKYKVKSILLSGGVAANQTLRETFEQKTKDQLPKTKLFVPAKNLCTDNGAMIATAAFFNYKPIPWQKITANPELYFD